MLARVAAAHLALGPPTPQVLPTTAAGPWCQDLPTWGNPSLQLERACEGGEHPSLAQNHTLGALGALKYQLQLQLE